MFFGPLVDFSHGFGLPRCAEVGQLVSRVSLKCPQTPVVENGSKEGLIQEDSYDVTRQEEPQHQEGTSSTLRRSRQSCGSDEDQQNKQWHGGEARDCEAV